MSAVGRTGETATGIGFLGIGSYLPSQVITNEEVAGPAGVTEEWILRKTGIHTRRRAKPDEATSDLATYAARAALEDAGLRPADISVVIVGTTTPDVLGPSVACHVAANLECPVTTAAFDVSAACSGFLYGVSIAEKMLRASGGHALVIGADAYTRFVNPADRRTAVLWGDGGGAAVLGAVEGGRGLLASKLMTYGETDLGVIPGGGSRLPATHQTVTDDKHYIHMNGRRISEIVKEMVPAHLRTFLDEAGVAPEDVTHVIPHQGNANMLESLRPLLGVPNALMHATARDYGNTGSASIPVTLEKSVRDDRITSGDTVLMISFGAGVTFAFALLRW